MQLTRDARVPTAAERVGDFSGTINRRGSAFSLFDPATTTVTAGPRIPVSTSMPSFRWRVSSW